MGDASGGAKRKPATSTTIPGLAVKKQKRSTVSFEDEIRINEKLSRVHDKEQSEDVLTCAVCRASGRRMDILSEDELCNADLYCISDHDSSQIGVLECRQCHVTVHTVCFGVRELVDLATWCCYRCREQPRQSVNCELCPNAGGAFVKLETPKKWVHASCSIWIPETLFSNWECPTYTSTAPIMTQPVIGLDLIDRARLKLKCKVCRQKMEQGVTIPKRPKGACIQCANGNCQVAAHVTCAQDSLFVFTDWDLFPSQTSMKMYCQDRHTPSWFKLELQKRKEKQLAPLSVGDKVRARYTPSAKKWYKGKVHHIEHMRYCWVRVESGEEYKLPCDQVMLVSEDEGEEVQIGKNVYLTWDDDEIESGEVRTMEEDVHYSVMFNDDDVQSDLRRSDILKESEWATKRPPGAEEGTDEEDEAEEEVEDVNSTDIDRRFIIEGFQRRAAAVAALEANKLLQDEKDMGTVQEKPPHAKPPAAELTTKTSLPKAKAPPTPGIVTPPVSKLNSEEIIATVKEQFQKWVKERKLQKEQRSKVVVA